MDAKHPALSLLHLPSEVWRNGIINVLSLLDIFNLDCAILSHALRPMFLSILRSCVRKQLYITDDMDINFLDWIVARGVRFEAWVYWEECLYNATRSRDEDCLKLFMGASQPLRSLEFARLSDNICFAMTTHLRSLLELSVDDCSGLCMKNLKLVAKCKLLTSLRLENITKRCDGALKCIFKACVELETIVLEGINKLTDDTILTLSQCCRKLSKLRIFSCGLTGLSATHIGKHCLQLKQLFLYNVKGNLDVGLLEIGKNCKYLTSLGVGWLEVTDVAIVGFCERCTQLVDLHITGCALGVESLHGVTKHLRSLKRLVIYNISDVRDADILLVAERLPLLDTLILPVSDTISHATLVKLAQNCPKLQTAELRTQHYLWREDLVLLAEGGPAPADDVDHS